MKKRRLSDYAQIIRTCLDLAYAKAAQLLEVDLLQRADTFLDLAGEDIRSRLLTTFNSDGVEMCLRPEFTIPATLHMIESQLESGFFVCSGQVYRLRAGQSAEVPQVGFEHFGAQDPFEADARVLALTKACVDTSRKSDLIVRTGEAGLFALVGAQLGAPRGWLRAWRKNVQVRPQSTQTQNAGVVAKALRALPASDVEAFVEDLLRLKGLSMIGHRTSAEIAERFVQSAQDFDFDAESAKRAEDVLSDLRALEVPLDQASDALGQFAQKYQLDLSAVQSTLNQRCHAFAQAGLKAREFMFCAALDQPMDYYTGLIFNMRLGVSDKNVASGGRYDTLAQMLGSPKGLGAVGAVIWLERLEGAIS